MDDKDTQGKILAELKQMNDLLYIIASNTSKTGEVYMRLPRVWTTTDESGAQPAAPLQSP